MHIDVNVLWTIFCVILCLVCDPRLFRMNWYCSVYTLIQLERVVFVSFLPLLRWTNSRFYLFTVHSFVYLRFLLDSFPFGIWYKQFQFHVLFILDKLHLVNLSWATLKVFVFCCLLSSQVNGEAQIECHYCEWSLIIKFWNKTFHTT